MSHARVGALMAAVAAGLWGCKDKAPPAAPPPRPVTVIALKSMNPTARLRLTGSAESWKQEDVGFEVSGRVEGVIEPGSEVLGRSFDENGKQITKGTVLARLDEEGYRLSVDSAKAQEQSGVAQVKALEIEIAKVLPAGVKAAKADLAYKKVQYEATRRLVAKKGATELEEATAKAAYKVAEAEVERIEAQILAKAGEVNSAKAQLRQYAEARKRAELDLRKCRLIAPFRGRVAAVHVIRGAYVQPGQAVATLVVMDPLKIEVAVSPATDRRINEGDPVMVLPPGGGEPVVGHVHVKETVADPKTRTFKVTILVRNAWTAAELPGDAALTKLLRAPYVLAGLEADAEMLEIVRTRLTALEAEIAASPASAAERAGALKAFAATLRDGLKRLAAGEPLTAEHVRAARAVGLGGTRLVEMAAMRDVMPVLSPDPGKAGPMHVGVDCIEYDDSDARTGPHVWRLEGIEAMMRGERRYEPIMKLKKVPVELTADRFSLLGEYVFRRIRGTPGLKLNDLLAIGAPKGIRDGDYAMLLRKRWQFRPGDLAQVQLGGAGPGAGFYVPMKAILRQGEGHYVFVVDRPDGGRTAVARKAPVALRGALGELRRIEGDGIGEGARVVLYGVAYLTDGEAVRVADVREVSR